MFSVSCLFQVLLASSPVPIRATKSFPVVKRCSAAWNPGVIVQTTASTKNLSSGIWFLDTSVVRSINHGSFVCPVVVAVTKLESSSWGCDLGDLTWITAIMRDILSELGGDLPWTSFNDEDRYIWVLGQTASNYIPSSTT